MAKFTKIKYHAFVITRK